MEWKLNSKIVGGSEIAEYNVAVMKALEWAVGFNPSLKDKGWRCIVEEDVEGELNWRLDISPSNGCGNECAEAKIRTLRKFVSYPNTGIIPHQLVTAKDDPDRTVNYYGGIVVPLTDYTPDGGHFFVIEKAMLYIAFSGAREDFDGFVAAAVFRAIEETWAKNHSGMYSHHDISDLKNDPVIGTAFALLGIE